MKIQQNGSNLGNLVSELAQTHAELWDQEDHARSSVDKEVVAAKKRIDVLNQKRNDLIEKIDEFVIQSLPEDGKMSEIKRC